MTGIQDFVYIAGAAHWNDLLQSVINGSEKLDPKYFAEFDAELLEKAAKTIRERTRDYREKANVR